MKSHRVSAVPLLIKSNAAILFSFKSLLLLSLEFGSFLVHHMITKQLLSLLSSIDIISIGEIKIYTD